MKQTQCSILDCEKPIKSRGYCKVHYRKFVFLPNHSLYVIWANMIQRCYNPRNPKYKDYGARGIKVCEQWRNSYRVFAVDVGLRPSPKHSVDRIDNDGNYEPNNVQWSTPIQQSMNRRMRCTNSSGITGVYFQKSTQRWHATITIDKRRHHLGLYKTLPEAARARYVAEAQYTVERIAPRPLRKIYANSP